MFETFRATRRLKDVEDAMSVVQRDMKRIVLEWEETYDKLRLMMQRVVKRAQALETSPPEGEAAVSEDSAAGTVPSAASSLSDRAQRINATILARRNRMQRPPS